MKRLIILLTAVGILCSCSKDNNDPNIAPEDDPNIAKLEVVGNRINATYEGPMNSYILNGPMYYERNKNPHVTIAAFNQTGKFRCELTGNDVTITFDGKTYTFDVKHELRFRLENNRYVMYEEKGCG